MPIFGAKSRAMRGCASKLACVHRIGPRRMHHFFGNLRRIRNIYWAGRVAGPYKNLCDPGRGGRLCPPADRNVFMKIFGKFVTSQRADVGIGPYKGVP